MTMGRVATAVLLVTALAAMACSGTDRPKTATRDAVIRIDCPITDARVLLNDRELGSVAQLRRGIALSPGTHRLEVKHPGYHTHYAALELTRSERRVIVVELAERFP